MTEAELRKLRAYYHALVGQQEIFSGEHMVQARLVNQTEFGMLASEIQRVIRDFPGALPDFHHQAFFAHSSERGSWYHVSAIRSYLAMAVGRLKVAIEVAVAEPVTQRRDFTFVKDSSLRSILERDYEEIQRAYIAKCWKSVIILFGRVHRGDSYGCSSQTLWPREGSTEGS